MATIYDYLMAVWVHIELPQAASDFEEELHAHLVESGGFQVNKLETIANDEEGADGEVQVSLRIQVDARRIADGWR